MEQNKPQLDYDVCDFGSGYIEYGIFDAATQIQGDTVTYIATVHDAGNESHARLFAAAPDMLTALESAENALHNLTAHNVEADPIDLAALATVRAAIARAKGES